MISTTNDQLLRDLMDACGAFAVEAVKRSELSPALLNRLTPCLHFVAVFCGTRPRARLAVQTERGHTAVVYQVDGEQFPAALGHASAAVIESGMSRLTNRARSQVAELQKRGHALGLIVSRESGSVQIVLGREGIEPVVVATLSAQEIRH